MENREKGLLPYPIILSATKGEPEAMNIVICHYDSQISYLSLRKAYDKTGNTYYGVNTDIRDHLRSKIMRAILVFEI
ncbi:hypothetical protein HMPREF9333_02043 [Johnsonella ignava ATCC 51276]|uniref:Helix-turn-helix conjugative transposon-like domain-containing protein n=1 Tax=Johnsonella ignava ATCC 51276 TaxID=679200 RepID=G5GKF2_9FIRM|nr:helix-turn-helix domain-containing protein [Johnsonella ignava]EHI54790.1 hypothetical protein HMPREF9333_02043 [Johnsonella ignava ATCC 51276]